MNTEVRLLNEKGTQVFREYLGNLRAGLLEPPPTEILDDVEFTRDLDASAFVDSEPFVSRREAATYLSDALKNVGESRLEKPELWGWLSLFYFDRLCPPKANGTRKLGKDYRYILSNDYRHYYRHLLAGPFRIYRTHGEAACIFLVNTLDEPGEINEQFASRQDILSNPGLIEAATSLYFSDKDASLKRGARSKGRGSVRRFAAVAYHLDLTYDLYSMHGNEIMKLLPSEFDRFRPDKE